MSESLHKYRRVLGWLALLCAAGLVRGGDLEVPEAQAKHAAITKPAPAISPLARQMKVSGRVELTVSIDADGSVSAVKLASGTPILGAGAIDAVKHWKFTPFTDASGAATKATTTLSFDFKQ